MYVRSQKFEYIGHWLSDVNTLEMKNFDTHLFFICNTSNYKPKISMKPKNADFLFQHLRPGKVPFATMQNIRLAR